MNTCSIHQNSRAAWFCTKCGANLCPRCAAEDSLQRGTVVRCLACGGIAQELMVRRVVKPYWAMFDEFLRAIFFKEGILQLLGVTVVMYLALLIPMVGVIVYAGIYASYYFLIIRRTAYGDVKLPLPTMDDLIEDVLAPLLRFIVATLIIWVPAAIYLRSTVGVLVFLAVPSLALHDPILLGLLILGIVYFPAAIMTAAVTRNTLAMLNPLVILGIVLRIPGHYFMTVVVWAVMNVADSYLRSLAGSILLPHYVKVLTPLLMIAISLIIPFLAALVLGRLLYQNGEVLGFTSERDLMVPEFPGARPLGTVPLAGWPDAREKKYQPVEPIALEPEPVPTGPRKSLATLLASGEHEQALEVFRGQQASGITPDLEPQLEMRLANLLERAGESLQAARACRRAAERDLKGPLAPQAIFSAARLLVESVGDKKNGTAMYQFLKDNYPDDPLSARAAELLRRLEVE